MSRLPVGFWGPRPRWAIIPLAALGVVLGSVAARQSAEVDRPVAVTALKPVPGDKESDGISSGVGAEGLPIEVRYGVPSPRTARLWLEPAPR